jgi:hypothetical protein
MPMNSSMDARHWLFAMMKTLYDRKFIPVLVTMWVIGRHGVNPYMRDYLES